MMQRGPQLGFAFLQLRLDLLLRGQRALQFLRLALDFPGPFLHRLLQVFIQGFQRLEIPLLAPDHRRQRR